MNWWNLTYPSRLSTPFTPKSKPICHETPVLINKVLIDEIWHKRRLSTPSTLVQSSSPNPFCLLWSHARCLSVISHYSLPDLYAIASPPRSFLIIMLNLLINPQVTLFFPSIKMAHNPVVNQGKKLREPQIEVFGSNQVQALHLWPTVAILTLLCLTKPRYLSSSVQIWKFCLFCLWFGCETFWNMVWLC